MTTNAGLVRRCISGYTPLYAPTPNRQFAVTLPVNARWPYPMALILLMTPALSVMAEATVVTGVEASSGLRSWQWRHGGISLQLIQRLPDQTRAFFQGRGLSAADAEIVAGSCVFQTIFRNDGETPLSYSLDDWQSRSGQHRQPLLTRERWQRTWQERDPTESARIAFRWSLLPTRQSFQPGDYNWGMISFGLPDRAEFDLELVVTVNGAPVSGTLPAVVCAEDRP